MAICPMFGNSLGKLGGGWSLMLPSGTSPVARMGHAADVVEEDMIIHGGNGGGWRQSFNDTWRFNPATRVWSQLIYSTRDELNPVARFFHTLHYIPSLNAFYMFGGARIGTNGDSVTCWTALDDFWSLDLASLAWVEMHPSTPGPSARWGAASAVSHQQGLQAASLRSGRRLMTFGATPPQQTWSQIQAADSPSNRRYAIMMYSEVLDELFIYGGQLGSSSFSAGVYRFTLASGQWSTVHNGQYDAPSARAGHAVLLPPGSILMFGGYYGSNRDDNWQNDESNRDDNWLIDLPLTQLCPAGQIHNGTSCEDCASGFYDARPEADECFKCPTNTSSDPGSADCLPLLAPWVQQQVPPNMTVTRNFAGKIQVVLKVPVLPSHFYGIPEAPAYYVDVAPSKESLQPRGACSVLWQYHVQNTELADVIGELTYDDLNDQCQMNETQDGDLIYRDGFLGIYVLVTGSIDSTASFFALPLQLKFTRNAEGLYTGFVTVGSHHIDQQVFLVGNFHSTVSLFRSESFDQPLDPAVYIIGDVVYAEHRLEAENLDLQVVKAWISSSDDPNDWAASSQNLSDSGFLTEQNNLGRTRFTFEAREQSCRLCFLHVLSHVTQLSDGRRLSMQEMHALKFRQIVIQPGEEALAFIMPIHYSMGLAVLVGLFGCILSLIYKCHRPNPTEWRCWCIPAWLALESFDCFLDIAAWLSANFTGDLEFSDDNGIVSKALFVSTIVSCSLFIVEVLVTCCGGFQHCPSLLKFLEAFHLGFEDLFQATFYTLATVSELVDSDHGVGPAIIFALFQALIGTGFKLAYETCHCCHAQKKADPPKLPVHE